MGKARARALANSSVRASRTLCRAIFFISFFSAVVMSNIITYSKLS